MTVDVDGNKYDVYLCDEHSETATMGAVRKKLTDTITKIKEIISIAGDLGININELIDPSLANTESLTPEPESTSSQVLQPLTEGIPSNTIQNTDVGPRPAPPQGSQPKQPTKKVVQPSHDKRIVKDGDEMPKLEEVNEVIEMQEYNIRGMPTQIPKHEKGACGTTHISIVNTSDQTIQRRLKNLDITQDHDGNYIPECRACSGSGVHPITNQTCPKCKGMGVMIC